MTVWKFKLPADDRVVLSMPIGAQVLHVYPQDAVGPCLWALVDTEAPTTEDRTFLVIGTGAPIDDPLIKYVGTFHIQFNMDYVFHVFEVLPDGADPALIAMQDFNAHENDPSRGK